MAHNKEKQSTEEFKDTSKTKAKWTLNTTHIFCDVCISAINKGLRPSTHFNSEGWKFVVSNFQKLSGLNYEKPKLKNKWDLMRSEWKLWKELIGKETGLGWDPRLETVDASPDWWKAKIQMNKEYARFQKKGIDPDIVSKNDFMFGSTVATGEFAWAPSSDADVLGKKDQNEDDIISLNDSADDPLQKSMDRFLQEDDIISDDNSNIGKKRKTRKRNIESGQGTSTNAKDKGPLFYKGWYHLFYQYNPDGAIWGNKIVWGHAVSSDLIHWKHLPVAMVTDHWYDVNGVWTGSATILPDGQIVMLYTGSTNESVQVQNLAYPADPSDPLLIEWVKYPGNPVLVPPPGIDFKDFRDPTTAWRTPEGKWRLIIGSKLNKTGISLVYDTVDFKNFTLLDGVLHAVHGTGMWECVDFYPVSKFGENGLDTSFDGVGVKHVMKASLDDDRNDYYAIGTYDPVSGKWVPDNPELDVGIGLRYDYGIYYASKTFYDSNKKRRVLWSWIKETDSEISDVRKGWASVQGIPRTILFDPKTGSNLLQWPVEEVNKLRLNKTVFENVEINTGAVLPLEIGSGSQLDITAEFEVDKESLERVQETNEVYDCKNNGGSSGRGALGPFGLLILADKDLSEQTPVYFYIAKGSGGNLRTFFCADHSRSSKAVDVDKEIYGSVVPVLRGEKLTMRILVDHSIVESFSQGGRTCITSRVYPTKAIYNNAKVFLFNNATEARIIASLNIWQMNTAQRQTHFADLVI